MLSGGTAVIAHAFDPVASLDLIADFCSPPRL